MDMFFGTVVALGMHIGSYHSEPGFNNVNPGAYVRTDEGYVAGAYRNSFKRTTVYAGRVWPVYGTLGVMAGVGTGYGSPGVPLGALVASYGRARVLGVPRIPGVNEAYVLHLTVERKF